MKLKQLFLVSVFFTGLTYSAFAQTNEYRHWSLNLKAGVDRGQFSGNAIKSGEYGFTAGIEIERTFNPLWGLALEGEYIDYSNFDIDASTFEVDVLGSLNMSNLLAKYRKGNWQRLNTYARLGVGLSFYSADIDQTTVVVPAGFAMEYNITKCLALGLIGERRWHTSSTMGLKPLGERAVLWSLLGNVRIKFGGSNHIRNTRLIDYEAALANDLNKYNDAPLKKALSDNENAVNQLKDQLNKANNDVQKLNNDLDKTNDDLNKTKEELEKCCKAKPSTTVGNNATVPQVQNVEFKFNESAINASQNTKIDALTEIMVQQSDLKVEIVGHTDNSGTEAVNKNLSVNRANAVANYLVKKGINRSRITTKGMGYSKPIASNDTAEGRQRNRRVEFFLSK